MRKEVGADGIKRGRNKGRFDDSGSSTSSSSASYERGASLTYESEVLSPCLVWR